MNADPWSKFAEVPDDADDSQRGDSLLMASAHRSFGRRASLKSGTATLQSLAHSPIVASAAASNSRRPSDILRAAQEAEAVRQRASSHSTPNQQVVKKRARVQRRDGVTRDRHHSLSVPRRIRYVRGIPGHTSTYRAGVSQAALSIFTESGQSAVHLKAVPAPSAADGEEQEQAQPIQLRQVQSSVVERLQQDRVDKSQWARSMTAQNRHSLLVGEPITSRQHLQINSAIQAHDTHRTRHQPKSSVVHRSPRRVAASVHTSSQKTPWWERRLAEPLADTQTETVAELGAALDAELLEATDHMHNGDAELLEATDHMHNGNTYTDDEDGMPGYTDPEAALAAAHSSHDDGKHDVAIDDSSVEEIIDVLDDDDSDDIVEEKHSSSTTQHHHHHGIGVLSEVDAAPPRKRVFRPQPIRSTVHLRRSVSAASTATAATLGKPPSIDGHRRIKQRSSSSRHDMAAWPAQAELLKSAASSAKRILTADVERRRVQNLAADRGIRQPSEPVKHMVFSDDVMRKLQPRAAVALVTRAVSLGATGLEVLFLAQTAELDEADKRYRKFARLVHPDRTAVLTGDSKVDKNEAKAAFHAIRSAIGMIRGLS